jgi:hypothetical protein
MSFSPKTPPKEYTVEYIQDLEQRIFSAFQFIQTQRISFIPSYSEPQKLKTNDVFLADGIHYDPGEGQGLYWYDGATFHKL